MRSDNKQSAVDRFTELYTDRHFLAWELGQQIGEKALNLADITIEENIILGEN